MNHKLNIGKVYWVKSGPTFKRLRVRINGKVTWCGKHIANSYYSLSYICADGNIRVRCEITGMETEIKTEVRERIIRI